MLSHDLVTCHIDSLLRAKSLTTRYRLFKEDRPNVSHAFHSHPPYTDAAEGSGKGRQDVLPILEYWGPVGLLCLKAELKHFHFVFSFSIFPSLGSCAAFKA